MAELKSPLRNPTPYNEDENAIEREATMINLALVTLIKQFGVDKVKQVSKNLNINDAQIKHAVKTLAKLEKEADTDLQDVINECAKEISL